MLTPSEIQQIASAVAELIAPLIGVQPSAELTTAEVAALLNVSKPTIERWVKEGRIPSYRVGRCRRFNRESVLSSVNSGSLD